MSDVRREMELLSTAKRDQDAKERIVLEMRQQVTELAPYKEQAFQLRANLVILEEKMRFREDENKRLQSALATMKGQTATEMEMSHQRMSSLEDRIQTLQSSLTRASEERDRSAAETKRCASDAASMERQLGIEKQHLQDSLNSARQQLQARNDANAELQRRVGESGLEAQRYEQQCHSLAKDFEGARTQISRAADEIAVLRAGREKAINETHDAIRQRDAVEAQAAALRKEADRIPQLVEHIETEKQMRYQELSRRDETLREIQTRLAASVKSNEEIPVVRRRAEETQGRAEQLQTALAATQRQLEDSLTALKEAVASKEETTSEVSTACMAICRGLVTMSPRGTATRNFRVALQLVRTVVTELSTETATLREQVAALSHVESQRRSLQAERETLQRRLEEERGVSQRTQLSAQMSVTALMTKEQETSRVLAEGSARLAELVGSLGSGGTALSPPRREGLDRVLYLPELVDTIVSRVRALQQQRDSVEHRAQHLEAAMEDLSRAHAEARGQLTATWGQMRDTQSALEGQLQRELITQRDRLSAEYELQLESISSQLRESETELARQRSLGYECRASYDELKIDISTERERSSSRGQMVETLRRQLDSAEREAIESRRVFEGELQRASANMEGYRSEILKQAAAKDDAQLRLSQTTGVVELGRKECEELQARCNAMGYEAEQSRALDDATWRTMCSLVVVLHATNVSVKSLRFGYRTLSRMNAVTEGSLRHLTAVCADALHVDVAISPRSKKSRRRPALRAVVILVMAARRLYRLRAMRKSTKFSMRPLPARECVMNFHGSAAEIASDTVRAFYGPDTTFHFDFMNRMGRSKSRPPIQDMTAVIAEVMKLKHLVQRQEVVISEKDELLRRYETEVNAHNTKGMVSEESYRALQHEVTQLRLNRSQDLNDMSRAQHDVLRRAQESEDLQRQLRETLLGVGTSAPLRLPERPHLSPKRSQPTSPRGPTRVQVRAAVSPPHTSPSRKVRGGGGGVDVSADDILGYIRQLDDRVMHALHHSV